MVIYLHLQAQWHILPSHILGIQDLDTCDEAHDACDACTYNRQLLDSHYQRKTAHNNPVANTADNAIFGFLGSCRFHILLSGSTSMEKSDTILIVAVAMTAIFILT